MPDSSPRSPLQEEITRSLGYRDEAVTTVPRGETSIPERFGRYEVRRVLGRGGMGTVYAAHDPMLHRDVALKVLRREGIPSLDTEGQQLLLREARAAAAISHLHIVTIYDVAELDGETYISMELLEGPSLRQLMRTHEPGSPVVLRALLQAARGLAAAHARGLVHRDFKPTNVMLRGRGEAVVLDFGLATVSHEPGTHTAPDLGGAAAPDGEEADSSSRFIVGTPPYMAPEQHLGRAVDARADQFSLCVVLYEALYGQRPFRGKGFAQLREQACSGEIPEPPSDASALARRLWPVIGRGLRPEPEARWGSIEELLVPIEREMGRARASRLAVLGLGVVAALVLSPLLLLPTSDPCSGAAEPLAVVWNDEVRARTREAVLATPVSHAERTWSHVESGLDELGTAWVDTRVSVCRTLGAEILATAEDPQVQCLDRRLAELRAFVELLEQPDSKVLDGAVMALPDPTAITTCEMAERTESPLPPEQAAAIAKADQEIDAIRVWLQADRIDEALVRARALLPEVESIDHPPLQARMHYVLGEAQVHRNEIDAAGAELEAGYELALGHDDALAARLAARLAHLRGYRQSRLDEGQTWRRHAEAALERAPSDPLATAYVEREVAVLLDASGEHEAALERLEHALELLETHYGPTHVQLLPVLSSLAVVQHRLGRLEAAVATHERTLALKRAKLGDDHPSTVHTLRNLAAALSNLDQLDEALAMMIDVLERQRASPHIDPMMLASTESSMGIILLHLGRMPEAQAAFERAVEGADAWTEERHPDAAIILIGLGNAAKRRGDLELATRAYTRSLAIQEALLGPDHPQLARSLISLAQVQRKAGDVDGAIVLLERAITVLEASRAPLVERWPADFELAQALWESGRERQRALELAEGSLRILTDARGEFARAEDFAEVEAWLAPRRNTLAPVPPAP